MALLAPKLTADAEWRVIAPQRTYGVRLNKEDTAFLRFGPAQGMYIAIAPASVGALVHMCEFEDGTQSLIGKVTEAEPAMIGRISECTIKILHAIMSRQHALLTLHGNVVTVKDMGSTNGTFFYKSVVAFDVDEYLETHSLDKAEESTLDSVHEQFGPGLNDFLRHYSQRKDIEPK